jgi:hypothetical protein
MWRSSHSLAGRLPLPGYARRPFPPRSGPCRSAHSPQVAQFARSTAIRPRAHTGQTHRDGRTHPRGTNALRRGRKPAHQVARPTRLDTRKRGHGRRPGGGDGETRTARSPGRWRLPGKTLGGSSPPTTWAQRTRDRADWGGIHPAREIRIRPGQRSFRGRLFRSEIIVDSSASSGATLVSRASRQPSTASMRRKIASAVVRRARSLI